MIQKKLQMEVINYSHAGLTSVPESPTQVTHQIRRKVESFIYNFQSKLKLNNKIYDE